MSQNREFERELTQTREDAQFEKAPEEESALLAPFLTINAAAHAAARGESLGHRSAQALRALAEIIGNQTMISLFQDTARPYAPAVPVMDVPVPLSEAEACGQAAVLLPDFI